VTSQSTGRDIPLWRDERVLRAAAQIVSAILIIGALIWTIINLIVAANQRGLSLGFQFISEPAGFPISETIFPYDPSRPFWYAFAMGVLNTLKVAIAGIFLTTILGTLIGLARMSTNWLLSKIALFYIEAHRNIPLLVLLFLWYFAFFNRLPAPAESLEIGGVLFLNQRGLYLYWFRTNPGGMTFLVAVLVGLILAGIVWTLLLRRRERTGQPSYFAGGAIGTFIVVAVLGWVLSGGDPLKLDAPVFEGFNFSGGLRLTPEFGAMLVGLVMYTAAFIAEVVRAGIQAVDRGQLEAARSVGLGTFQILGLVIIPQALRIIIPPLISQYLNLTKNSSLAVAIGYADLFNVGRIVINQAGRAVPVFASIMVAYLTMSLFTSFILNIYNRRIQFVSG
jgi:general L-amino acid transport system permease protein